MGVEIVVIDDGEFRKNKLLAIFLLLVLGSFGKASFAAGWSADLTVDQVFTEGSSDYIGIYTTGGTTYTAGCSPNVWLFDATDDARRSRAYSTVMAALVSGKKIRFWYSDTCGTWNWHSASSVMLVK